MRENADGKGRRLLTEGRLTVEFRGHADITLATCRGDSGEVYDLGFDHNRGWWCTCPARTTCSHLKALMLVTVRQTKKEEAA